MLGCNNNYNQKQIVVPSSITVWNKNDEFPSIISCEQIESESERNICFQQKLTKSIFDNIGAVIKKKNSSNNNYTSISVNVIMDNPEAVIEKYKEVSKKVNDVILL